jgi:rabenosyn-5
VRPDSPGTPEVIDPDSSLAHQLQPLLEQEALVESFIQEANESRKFEDAKILRQNLEEIRMEIQKMTVGAKLGVVQSGKGV